MPDPILLHLIRINRYRLRGLRKVLAPHGYTGSMHLILSHVCRESGASQEQIACYYALDKTAVARDARRLEELGHIVRSTVPEDRRRYALHPTDAGREMYAVICEYYDALAKTLQEDLSAEERDSLQQTLARIAQKIKV